MVASAKRSYPVTGKQWRTMILLPWLALPLTLGCYFYRSGATIQGRFKGETIYPCAN